MQNIREKSGLSIRYITASVLVHVLLFTLVVQNNSSARRSELPNSRSEIMHVGIYQPTIPKQANTPPQMKENALTNHESEKTARIQVRDIAIPALPGTLDKKTALPESEFAQAQKNAELTPIIQPKEPQNPIKPAVEIDVVANARAIPKTINKKEREYGGGVDWVSMLPAMVATEVQRRLPIEQSSQLRECTLSIHLSADGTLVEIDNISGDQVLCLDAKEILYELGGFKLPEEIPDSQSHLRHLIINVESPG